MNITETIRKAMGWCPKANTPAMGKSVQFNGKTVQTPAPGGAGSFPCPGWKWWNRYHNRILLFSFFLTLMAMGWFNAYGRSEPYFFKMGAVSGLLFSLLSGIIEWHRLNKAAAGEYVEQRVRRKQGIKHSLLIGGFIAFVMFLTGFFAMKILSISVYCAFISGFILFVWTQYLEVLYWEWKNRKVLIVDKASFYAVEM